MSSGLGGGSAVPDGGPDSSSAALWDSGSAPHAVPALPALHLPQDRRGCVVVIIIIIMVTLHLTLTPLSLSLGLLDTFEGPNLAPIQRVPRDVQLMVNGTAGGLGVLRTR